VSAQLLHQHDAAHKALGSRVTERTKWCQTLIYIQTSIYVGSVLGNSGLFGNSGLICYTALGSRVTERTKWYSLPPKSYPLPHTSYSHSAPQTPARHGAHQMVPTAPQTLQGYLAHKKQRPPRTLQKDDAWPCGGHRGLGYSL
jgi:hypothetical protein